MDKLIDRIMKLQAYNKTLIKDNQEYQKRIDDTIETIEEYKIDIRKKKYLIDLLTGAVER